MTYPLPGFGAISGMCDVIDDELLSPAPSVFRNHIDFMDDPFDDPADAPYLTPGGQQILDEDNAGGSSLYSEMFAYEVLARCEGADLLKTETTIVYDPLHTGSITDFLVEMDALKVGVSVVRAFKFPPGSEYTVADAQAKMEEKLSGILSSSSGVAPEDAWVKQVLHVIAYADMHADSVEAALALIDPAIKADTIVVITVTDGDDSFAY